MTKLERSENDVMGLIHMSLRKYLEGQMSVLLWNSIHAFIRNHPNAWTTIAQRAQSYWAESNLDPWESFIRAMDDMENRESVNHENVYGIYWNILSTLVEQVSYRDARDINSCIAHLMKEETY